MECMERSSVTGQAGQEGQLSPGLSLRVRGVGAELSSLVGNASHPLHDRRGTRQLPASSWDNPSAPEKGALPKVSFLHEAFFVEDNKMTYLSGIGVP